MTSHNTHNRIGELGDKPDAKKDSRGHETANVTVAGWEDNQTGDSAQSHPPAQDGQSRASDAGAPTPPDGQVPQDPYLPAAQAQHVQGSSSGGRTRCKTATAGPVSFRVTDSEADELERARLLMNTAFGASVVSLFFGGALVSALGVLAAVICLVKFNTVGKNHPDDPRIARYLRRNGIIAVTVSVAALALNAAIAIAMYPMVMEMLESGNLDQLFSMPGAGGDVNAATPDSNGSITWG